MATAENSTPKKLTELRVVDLKSELEKRGLEKTGVKAALTERLKKVGPQLFVKFHKNFLPSCRGTPRSCAFSLSVWRN